MNKRKYAENVSRHAAAVMLAVAAVPAWAQDKAPDAAATAATTPAATPGGLQEIVVTASRRAENLQKESRAISAVSAQELTRQGITDASALQKVVPGLTIARNGSQLQISVRGVGDRSITLSTDPAIAINIDGVYYPKSYEAAASFYDLERVEVLKGPQGTLYGRNASAGAINLIVAKPKFETSGFGEIEVGNYNEVRGTGAVNFALSPTVAFRLSGQVVRRDGYLTDGYNDDREQAARAQVLIAPTSDTSLLLTSTYSHLGGIGEASVIAKRFDGSTTSSPVPDPSNPWAGPTDPATLARIAATNPSAYPRIFRDGFQNVKVYTLAADFEHHMDWATITLIPAYVGSTIKNLNYASIVVPIYLQSTSNQFSMEARLSSPAGSRIKWVAGAFGSAEDVSDQSQARVAFVPGPPGTPSQAFDNVTVSPQRNDRTAAAFGEVNASITDRLRLIGGIRYTWERKTTVGYNAAVFAPIPHFPLVPSDILFPTTGDPTNGQLTSRAVNYRAGAEYDIAPRSMVYATVSTGFKAGGFIDIPAPNNTYKPEKLTSYQAGIKNRFFDNRLQLNVEGFYWDYKNKQETFIASENGLTFLKTFNAGKVTMYGGDVSIAGQITPRDTITADGEYLHSKYDSYIYSYALSPSTPIDPTINCPTSVVAGVATVNCSGNVLVRAPKWSGRVGYTHVQPLGDIGELSFNAGMSFSSSYFLTNTFTALSRASSYQLYDASLAWTSANKRFSVTGFIKNIGNTAVYTGGAQSANLTDAVLAQIAPPRTFGGRFRVNF